MTAAYSFILKVNTDSCNVIWKINKLVNMYTPNSISVYIYVYLYMFFVYLHTSRCESLHTILYTSTRNSYAFVYNNVYE